MAFTEARSASASSDAAASAAALRCVNSSAGGASAAGAGAGAGASPTKKLYLSSKSFSFCCFFAMAAAGSAWFSRMSPTCVLAHGGTRRDNLISALSSTSDGITKMTRNARTPSAT